MDDTDRGPIILWATHPLQCLSCFHTWQGVYPAGLSLYFECSNCGKMEGVRVDTPTCNHVDEVAGRA